MNLILALSAFNWVGSQDFLCHPSCLNTWTICSARKKNAMHYRAADTKMLVVHFWVTFQHGPVCLPLSSPSKTEAFCCTGPKLPPYMLKSSLHLLLHRRQREVSSPDPFPYITVIIVIKFPLFSLKGAQLALIPQFPPNTAPPHLLVESSLLCRNVCPRS